MALTGQNGVFWTASPERDPKRGFRFQVQFGGGDILWYAKKADKPTLSFTESSHQYLNHTYYWPARAEWNEVSITFVDPVEPDLAGDLLQALTDSGYKIPAGFEQTDFQTVSKRDAVASLGPNEDVIIIQIDELGNPLEKWILKHAWIKEVTFGELDYGSDDLTEVMVKFRYDWAEAETHTKTDGFFKRK